jgi:hypothetical protein
LTAPSSAKPREPIKQIPNQRETTKEEHSHSKKTASAPRANITIPLPAAFAAPAITTGVLVVVELGRAVTISTGGTAPVPVALVGTGTGTGAVPLLLGRPLLKGGLPPPPDEGDADEDADGEVPTPPVPVAVVVPVGGLDTTAVVIALLDDRVLLDPVGTTTPPVGVVVPGVTGQTVVPTDTTVEVSRPGQLVVTEGGQRVTVYREVE